MTTPADLIRALENAPVVAHRADAETLAALQYLISRASDYLNREWERRQLEKARHAYQETSHA